MISLSRAIEGFLLEKSASGRSHHTLRNYRNQLNRFCNFVQDPLLDQVEAQEIQHFFVYLREDYRITKIGSLKIEPRSLTAKTIKNAWGTLSVFWSWAANEFHIETPFHVKPIQAPIRPIDPLDHEDIQKLLRACGCSTCGAKRPTKKRDRAIILTLLDTGIRVSELCGARIGDLDLETGRLLVSGKGGKTRFVYLGRLTRRAIWQYLNVRYPQTAPKKDEPLFVDREGLHPLTRHGVRTLVRSIGGRAGVDGVHPHRFRHTFAVQILRNGGDVFVLQQLLGHSSLDMVRRYVQLAEMDIEETHRRASPADNWRLR